MEKIQARLDELDKAGGVEDATVVDDGSDQNT
jgi:hypothetical protein